MSDEGDRARHGSDADGDEEGDAVDVLDDLETEIDDPFAELGAGVDGGEFEGTDPAGPDDSDIESDPSSAGSVPDAGRDDPFDEIGPADAGTDLDDAFEQMDVGGAAEVDVWESLDADVGTAAAGLGEATSAPDERDTEQVVSKRTYCQQCPHFTSPPDVACTHEGTSILEAVGFDEFRVRNCPMVTEEDPTFDADG